MMAMSYSEEQLRNIDTNLRQVNSKAAEVLKAIKEDENINHGEIYIKAKLSKYVTDKCITAFIVCGFIKKNINGLNISYELTEDGEKYLKLIEGVK